MTLIGHQDGAYLYHVDRKAGQNIQFTIDPNNPGCYSILFDNVAYLMPINGFRGFKIELVEAKEPHPNPLIKNIDNYFKIFGIKHAFCVDIGASDGLKASNTYALYQRGWSGLSVECDSRFFTMLVNNYRGLEKVNMMNLKVTPDNVLSLLKTNNVPAKLDFLDVDIDGYDYHVLDKILRVYRPTLVCAEINEKIPPPIKFSVKFDEDFTWGGFGSHFYGQSIAKVYELCEKYDYALLELNRYVNVFLCPKEIAPHALTPEEAYQVGYRNKVIPEHNRDIAQLLDMTPEEGIEYLNELFKEHKGQYDLSL